MAKNFSSIPMTASEIASYLDEKSDFGFEIGVLKQLCDRRVECEHGGTYDDPITQKKRQFDVRAKITLTVDLLVRLAIECKNLDRSFPLVVQCMKRRKEESFHEVLHSKPQSQRLGSDGLFSQTESTRLEVTSSFYPLQGLVGKSCQQVGKTDKGVLCGDNSEIYDKWSQAINSAHGLLDKAFDDGKKLKSGVMVSILPVLVVPDETLWTVEYDDLGNRAQAPVCCERVSYFMGVKLLPANKMQADALTLSHLEICTLSGLLALIEMLRKTPPDETLFDLSDH